MHIVYCALTAAWHNRAVGTPAIHTTPATRTEFAPIAALGATVLIAWSTWALALRPFIPLQSAPI